MTRRAPALESAIAGLDGAIEELVPRLGRLLVIEAEYERAMRQAELAWVRSLIQDLRRKRLAWKPEAFIRRGTPPRGRP